MISQNIKTLVALKAEADLEGVNTADFSPIYTPATEEQFSSMGIIPNEDGELVKIVQNFEILEVGQSFRKVNKKKVKRLAKERIAALKEEFIPSEEQEEFFVSKDTIKSLEYQISIELLPETEVDETSHYVIHDKTTDFLFVTNTNKKGSEDITALLRRILGSFPVTELSSEEDVSESFTQLILSGKTTNRLEFGDYILMTDALSKGKVMFTKELVTSKEVVNLLEEKVASSIGLGYDGIATFTLNTDLSFKGFKFNKEFIDCESSFYSDALLVANELVGIVTDISEIIEA